MVGPLRNETTLVAISSDYDALLLSISFLISKRFTTNLLRKPGKPLEASLRKSGSSDPICLRGWDEAALFVRDSSTPVVLTARVGLISCIIHSFIE